MKIPVDRIQTDFKKLMPGDWFLPVTLKEVDQHSLIPEAVLKGIAGFLYEDRFQLNQDYEIPHFSVPSLREFLFAQARSHRPLLNLRVATVSGSNGKTSVKELLGCVLRKHFGQQSFISPENQNTKIALANQILRMPESVHTAAFEVGARKVGDFKIPFSYLQPSIVSLVNIGTAHLGEFGSIENLEKEKLSVFQCESAKVLIANADDPRIINTAVATGKTVISFGYSAEAQVRIVSENATDLEFEIAGQKSVITCSFKAPARAMNVAATLAISMALDISLESVLAALKEFQGTSRRFEKKMWNGIPIIDDAFNSSPEGVKAGLQLMKDQFRGQRILFVLGSMLELGPDSSRAHKGVADFLQQSFPLENFDLVTIGSEAEVISEKIRSLHPRPEFVLHFGNVEFAKTTVEKLCFNYDVIYFKGSKSIGLQRIFEDS